MALLPHAFAQQYLLNRLDLNVGSDPRGAVSADFNNDGRPDLAVANQGSNSVSVTLGQPSGLFGAASNYATGTGPYGIVAGDFNNDGNQDLAITNVFDNTVSILLGNGNGTFTIKSVPSVGSLPVAIVAGDFNNDGKLDLAVPNLAGNSVSVLMGKGDGTFQNQVVYSLTGCTISGGPVDCEPRAIVEGFFNSDNSLDLVVVDSGGNALSILLGSSSGTFTVQSTQYATGVLPFWIATGDFNGDHIVDLAVANQCGGDLTCGTAAGTVSVLLGNGNGTFQPQVVFNVGAYPDYVWAGPLAINGAADIVTANSGSDTISVLISTGNNTFQNHQDYATGGFPYSLAGADFNGDGLPDFAISNAVSNTATILLGDGDGTFTERKVTSTGLAPEGVAVGNLNGDGNLDAAVADSTASSVSILLGNGDGTFTTGSTLTTAAGPSGVVIADFNGDGTQDVAAANASSNNVSVMLGTGGGSFGSHVEYATGASPVGLAAADVNNDGHIDLITANSADNKISVLLGTGNGTFNAHQDYAVGTMPVAVAVADLNNDGKQDLVVANSIGNTISVLLGNGTGAYATQTAYIVGYGPLGVAVGDMNNDSTLDIVTANSGGGSVAVLLGNGDGTFQKHVNFTVPGANNLALGDLNGDGKLDVVATSSNGVASVLLGSAGGSLQSHIDYGLGTKPFAVATGNFDSAGGLDFIATSLGSNAVAVFVNLPAIGLYPPSFNFGTVGVGQQSTQTLTITNPGPTPLSVSSITTTGDYSEQGQNCVTILQQGASCTAMITFAPTQSGTRTGTASVNDNAPASPQMLPLTGVGQSGVSLNPTSLNFGNISVGTSSSPMPVTLTNSGSTTLTITSITTTSQYTQTNNCGGSIGAGQSCTINVTFTPSQEGTVNGTLTVTDNANNSPQTASLTGVGLEPLAQLLPTSINFGDELVNTTSPTQTVTLTNIGNATMSNISVSISGPSFLKSNECSTTLNAGSSCNILVAFKPTGVGSFTGTLSVTDNAPGSPQTVSLSGSGTLVTLMPSSVNFGTVNVGQSSAPQSITVTNKSTNLPLTISNIGISGANGSSFTQTNNCPTSLPAQSSCTAMVTFTPLVTGSLTAQLQVFDNGGGSPQTASLMGTGN